jgi:hypothetical protein
MRRNRGATRYAAACASSTLGYRATLRTLPSATWISHPWRISTSTFPELPSGRARYSGASARGRPT